MPGVKEDLGNVSSLVQRKKIKFAVLFPLRRNHTKSECCVNQTFLGLFGATENHLESLQALGCRDGTLQYKRCFASSRRAFDDDNRVFLVAGNALESIWRLLPEQAV